ncbi:MAG TPA: BON domain-containing protein [Vicinamibacterales bacterium]|nr:BON domain-containing protein [Vicinamibacterales bacterium]
MINTLAFSIAALAVSVNVAAAASVNVADRKDFQILKDIATSVERYTQFTIFDDVSARVKDGSVTLTGRVTMPYKRDDIERRVSKIDGVVGIRDEITVLPASTFDDELRFKIARSIYGHSNFWNYAIMPNPPIHIIVEHGRVTLTGVVNSQVDRVLAHSLASQFNAFAITNELKTDAEVREALEKNGKSE